MHTALLALNFVASLGSTAFGVLALVRPAALSGSSQIDRGEMFYVRMYAARAIPFGLAAGMLPFWFGGNAVAYVLFTAAAIQAADVVIRVETKDRGMIVGPLAGALVHLVCGLTIR